MSQSVKTVQDSQSACQSVCQSASQSVSLPVSQIVSQASVSQDISQLGDKQSKVCVVNRGFWVISVICGIRVIRFINVLKGSFWI